MIFYDTLKKMTNDELIEYAGIMNEAHDRAMELLQRKDNCIKDYSRLCSDLAEEMRSTVFLNAITRTIESFENNISKKYPLELHKVEKCSSSYCEDTCVCDIRAD